MVEWVVDDGSRLMVGRVGDGVDDGGTGYGGVGDG